MPSVMLLFRNTISVSTITEKKTEISMCSNLYWQLGFVLRPTYLPCVYVECIRWGVLTSLSLYVHTWRAGGRENNTKTPAQNGVGIKDDCYI